MIELKRCEDVIVFLGGMNAMPMMYALELKKKGFNVLYFVDAKINDSLSRPENHFPGIEYPYPDWIVELKLETQMLLPLFPYIFAKYIDRIIASRINAGTQCYVLNGFFCALSPYLMSSAKKVSLSHGADLHTWANKECIQNLKVSFKKRSFFKFLPKFLSDSLIENIVHVQYEGFKKSDVVVYFPKGFNPLGDKVIDSLKYVGVETVERFDISFEPLKLYRRINNSDKGSDKLVLFSGVRFIFKTFVSGSVFENKGTDDILKGIALYKKRNEKIVIHLVEKGIDLDSAKQLSHELGLEPNIIWHKEMPFSELLNLYEASDICFDQVGSHWIGAIGGYALYLKKPLIANDLNFVESGFWPSDNPVYRAQNAEDVFQQLVRLENKAERDLIASEGYDFALKYLSPNATLGKIFDIGKNY